MHSPDYTLLSGTKSLVTQTSMGVGKLVGDALAFGLVAVTSPLWIPLVTGRKIVEALSKPPQGMSKALRSTLKASANEDFRFFQTLNSSMQQKLKKLAAADGPLPGFDYQQYNVGVIGVTKVGKSSLINAIIGVNNTHPGELQLKYAYVGCVRSACPQDSQRSIGKIHLFKAMFEQVGALYIHFYVHRICQMPAAACCAISILGFAQAVTIMLRCFNMCAC